MEQVHPIRLEASLHETIWGGRRLEQERWKQFPDEAIAVGEAWETEVNTRAQNAPYTGKTLGALVDELGPALLGEQALAIFGQRFPLLAKFIDANAPLSVQVHPDDLYAHLHEDGKLGKTEFWYILSAEPGATIIHGFNAPTTRSQAHQAIEDVTLEQLLHEEPVQAGDIIFVPAGTVHAIGGGILLYELQEYSDITYRMYDYGRLTAAGQPRELHIERSLDVSHYTASTRIKACPLTLPGSQGYDERCLVACRYFVTRELFLHEGATVAGQPAGSCLILSSLGAELQVRYGTALEQQVSLRRGQTMVLPAALGEYQLDGHGTLLCSYVPSDADPILHAWEAHNR